MEAILNVSSPIFGIILCGYLAGRAGLLGDAATEALSKFVFYIALPPLLFLAMARAPVAQIFYWPFIGSYLLGQSITFVVALIVARGVFGLRPAERSLFAMAAIFGNTGYMGIPLAITAFGEAAALPAVVATVINSAIVITVVVILIEADMSEKAGMLGILGDVSGALIRNPLLVAPILGILISLSGLPRPVPLERFCSIVGAAAGPGALFALGLFLVDKPMTAGLDEVGVMAALKLLIQPAITLALFLFVFPATPLWQAVGVIMAALPVGANVFVLAQRYNRYVARSSAITLISTGLSVITVSILLIHYQKTAGIP